MKKLPHKKKTVFGITLEKKFGALDWFKEENGHS